MKNSNPILIIGSDQEDFEIFVRVFNAAKISNELVWLKDGKEGLDYLRRSDVKPFLILSDVYMPGMSGLEFRREIEEDPKLRSKSVPFIFLSESLFPTEVNAVYSMSVQGLFDKRNTLPELTHMVSVIYRYWELCRHPDEPKRLSHESS